MRLRNYYEFLLESVLLTSDSLSNIIKSIDDPIAQKFYGLMNKDIKTKFNIVNLTDTNDKLSFIPDSQASTKIKSGIDPNDLFNDKVNQTTIGRVVRGILTDNNITYTDRDIEKFVNKFKAAYDSSKIKSSKVEQIRIVNGEDIRYWYLADRYCEETLDGKGSLGKSCMRHVNCQKYLDIYVNNPEQVSLVIYVDNNEKLRSRSVLWKTNAGYILDRVYYTSDSDEDLVRDWVSDNVKDLIKSNYKQSVLLTGNSNPDGSYNYYPYMDQFMYYHTTTKTLYNNEPSVGDRKNLLELQDTGGDGNPMDEIYCEYEDRSYPADMVVHSSYHDSYIHRDNAVYSRHIGTYIWSDNACYSEALDDYYPDGDAVTVYLDDDKEDSDYYPDGHDDITFDEIEGVYFLSSLMIEDDDGNRGLRKNILKVVKILEDSIEKYKEIYNIPSDTNVNYSNPIDGVLFDIKLDDTQSKNILNKKFYISNYSFMLYTKLENMLEKINFSDIKSEKQSEIEIVDGLLGKFGSIFDSRNQIYKLGMKQFDVLWRSNISESFDSCFSYVSMIRDRPITRLGGRYPNFLNKLKKLSNDLLLDPKEFISAYSTNQVVAFEKNKLAASKIDSAIFEAFPEMKDSNREFLEVVEYIQLIYNRLLYESNYQYFQSVRWSKIYDVYLRNQSSFVDIN